MDNKNDLLQSPPPPCILQPGQSGCRLFYHVVVTSKIPIKRMISEMGIVLGITWSREVCRLEEDVKKADIREF